MNTPDQSDAAMIAECESALRDTARVHDGVAFTDAVDAIWPHLPRLIALAKRTEQAERENALLAAECRAYRAVQKAVDTCHMMMGNPAINHTLSPDDRTKLIAVRDAAFEVANAAVTATDQANALDERTASQ